MAKKASSRKPAKKSAKKSGAKKSAPKKSAAKKAASKPRVDPTAPRPIGSGKGATPAEIGRDIVAMINSGAREDEIWAKWFSPKLVSIESMGQAWHGMKAVKGKAEWFYGANTVHSMSAEGPYVGATGFALRFNADIEEKATGNRMTMTEVGVYTVLNGRVIQEEFMPIQG